VILNMRHPRLARATLIGDEVGRLTHTQDHSGRETNSEYAFGGAVLPSARADRAVRVDLGLLAVPKKMDLLTYPWVGESIHDEVALEDPQGLVEHALGRPRGHCRSGAQPPQNGRNPLLSQGLRVRATLRCHKAKRSQAVKGGPSGPSEGSRAAAPLTAWGAELRAYGLANAFSEGPRCPDPQQWRGSADPVEALTPPTDLSVAPHFGGCYRSGGRVGGG
jgi:hypothetical protein